MLRSNLRAWAVFAAVASATLSIAQDQPKVTLTMPASKASEVLAEISKQTGVYLASDPIVGNLPVLVSVTDAPLNTLLHKIADAVGGEVQAQGEGYRLVNDLTQRREEEAREKQWVLQAFERGKQRALSDMTGTGRWDEKTMQELVAKAEERRQQLMQRIGQVERQQGSQVRFYDSSLVSVTPASAAAKRALSMLSTSVLASLAPGDRIVYATSPTRMQSRMPFNVTQVANDFVYNHNMLAKSAPQLRGQQGIEFVGTLTSGEPIAGVADTHLILSRGYRSTTINVEIKFVDQNGIYVGHGSASVTPDYGRTQGGTASGEGKEITLTELSRQMAVIMAQEMQSASSDRQVMRLAQSGGGGGAFVTMVGGEGSLPKRFSDDLLNVFVNPDKFDPAALYVSESYSQAAKADGKNLVASFPDSIVRDLARVLVGGTVTGKGVLASSPGFGLNVEDKDGWLFITPTWANLARETRFDRDAAAKLYRAVNTRGFATLEELSDYSMRLVTGTPDRPLDMVYLGLVNKDVGDQLNEYVMLNLDLLRLYGTIPENAKRQAGEAYGIQYRALSGTGKELAARAYYNRAAGFSMQFAGPAQGMAIVTMETQGPGGRPSGPPPNSVLNEPTEVLPNGIPAEAMVSLLRTLQDGVFAKMKDFRGGGLFSAEELGMRQGMLEANMNANFQVPSFDTFILAQIVQVELSIELGEYGRPSANFKDGWLLNNARPMTWSQLPEGFRNTVNEWRTRFMSPPQPVRIGRRDGGGGGGG